MREVLFRGKTNFEGRESQWVYGSLLAESSNTFPIIAQDYDNDEEWIGIIEWATVDTETVGQYTGLTDKNGKKIFEGDIVNCITSDFDGSDKYVYNFKITNITDYEQMGFLDFCHEIEIIGNIHDNPITEVNGDER